MSFRVLKLTAENVKRLSVVEIVPDGDVVQITGPNGSGKSSVVDALFYAMAGAGDLPRQPIRHGQESARIRVELGELIVTRKFTEDGKTTVAVESADGARYPSPQKMLDSLVGALTFDPLAFTRMKPAERIGQLRRLVPLEIDVDSLQAENNRDTEVRRDVNRRHKEALGAASSIVVVEGLPDEPIDTAALLAKMQAASERNTAIERTRWGQGQRRAKIEQLAETINFKRDQAGRLLQEADALTQQMNDEHAAMEAEPPLEASIDLAALREQIADAKMENDAIAQRTLRREHEATAERLKAQADGLTKDMADRTATIRAAIAAAPMPIPGLGFDAEDVSFNGVPFDQASGAEQLRMSMAIAMAANPKLRVLCIKDGSLLDAKGMEIVRDMARDQDYQLWIERVETETPVGIIMEDGHVREVINA